MYIGLLCRDRGIDQFRDKFGKDASRLCRSYFCSFACMYRKYPREFNEWKYKYRFVLETWSNIRFSLIVFWRIRETVAFFSPVVGIWLRYRNGIIILPVIEEKIPGIMQCWRRLLVWWIGLNMRHCIRFVCIIGRGWNGLVCKIFSDWIGGIFKYASAWQIMR